MKAFTRLTLVGIVLCVLGAIMLNVSIGTNLKVFDLGTIFTGFGMMSIGYSYLIQWRSIKERGIERLPYIPFFFGALILFVFGLLFATGAIAYEIRDLLRSR